MTSGAIININNDIHDEVVKSIRQHAHMAHKMWGPHSACSVNFLAPNSQLAGNYTILAITGEKEIERGSRTNQVAVRDDQCGSYPSYWRSM